MLREKAADNLLKHVLENEQGCWIWQKGKTHNGYPLVSVARVMRYAHRLQYERTKGPIPPGMDLDHLCRNRDCINPEHLEPVTRSENLRRGAGAQMLRARHAAVTHCPQGHPYNAENTYLRPNGRGRLCRLCQRAAKKSYRERRKGENL